MTNQRLYHVYKIAIAIALVIGLVFTSVSNIVSHLPDFDNSREQTRHAELTTEIEDHGHSHDDGETFEQKANHSHDHNPADHSHEIPHLAPYAHPFAGNMVRSLVAPIPQFIQPEAIHGLDRPPKPVSLI
jgi:hypothetical protein